MWLKGWGACLTFMNFWVGEGGEEEEKQKEEYFVSQVW